MVFQDIFADSLLVVCERFLNVQTPKQHDKNGSWSGPILWYNPHNG